MRVMVTIRGTPGWDAGEPPDERLLTAMSYYNEELVKAGIMLDGECLHPSSSGVRVRFSGATRTLTHGPFTEPSEVVAGYWLWQVRSVDEAIEWAKRCPNPMAVDSVIEIRPVLEMEDAGSEPPPAARENDEPLRREPTTT